MTFCIRNQGAQHLLILDKWSAGWSIAPIDMNSFHLRSEKSLPPGIPLSPRRLVLHKPIVLFSPFDLWPKFHQRCFSLGLFAKVGLVFLANMAFCSASSVCFDLSIGLVHSFAMWSKSRHVKHRPRTFLRGSLIYMLEEYSDLRSASPYVVSLFPVFCAPK